MVKFDQLSFHEPPISLRIKTKITKACEVFHVMMASAALASSTHTGPLNPCPRPAPPQYPGTLLLDTRVRLVQKGLESSSIMSQLKDPFFKEIFADLLDVVTAPPGNALQLLIKGQIQAIIR